MRALFSMFDVGLVYGLALVVTLRVWLLCSREPARSNGGQAPSGKPAAAMETSSFSWQGIRTGTFGLAVMCLAVLASRSSTPYMPKAKESPRIGYYIAWDAGEPTYKPRGGFGIAGTGMYGLLLDDLKRHGATMVDLLPPPDQEELANPDPMGRMAKEMDLDRARNLDLIVLMVRSKRFSPEELRFLENYLREGGQILMVGDHTNLENNQTVFNQLGQPHGMTLEFDSAFSFTHWWAYNLQASSRLPFAPDNAFDYGWGTGGSISVRPPARPVLVSRYAFGDLGNILKRSRKEAFLGDYTYQHGERLGDMVLMAEAPVGRGRLVTCGDSSSFQNIAYVRSGWFVRQLIDRMVGGAGEIHEARTAWREGALGVLLLAALCIPVTRKRVWGPGVVAACVLATLWGLQGGAAQAQQPAGRSVLLDLGTQKINRDMFVAESYLGLPLNLYRLGCPAYWEYEISPERLAGAEWVFLIAPTRRLSSSQYAVLDDYMRSGGKLVVCAGYDAQEAAGDLLKRYGMAITDTPLGGDAFPNKDGITPTFVEAWQISAPADARAVPAAVAAADRLPDGGLRRPAGGRRFAVLLRRQPRAGEGVPRSQHPVRQGAV